MTEARPGFILTLSCPDRPGIVAATTRLLADHDWSIVEIQQYSDPVSKMLFMRLSFDTQGSADEAQIFADEIKPVAEKFGFSWQLHDRRRRLRTVLMVSKTDHCLADLLYRWRMGELAMDPVAIIGNHPLTPEMKALTGGLPFYHLPVTKDTKLEQETQVFQVVREVNAELIVLARYMQILSDGLAAKLSGRCINIHHSFLPGFKGARPYHQAHARGVKVIGATAHYVTADLDEGPIIEQDVERISHSDSPDALVRKGRDIEARVLSRAVRWHLEHRVFLNGDKTIIFQEG